MTKITLMVFSTMMESDVSRHEKTNLRRARKQSELMTAAMSNKTKNQTHAQSITSQRSRAGCPKNQTPSSLPKHMYTFPHDSRSPCAPLEGSIQTLIFMNKHSVYIKDGAHTERS